MTYSRLVAIIIIMSLQVDKYIYKDEHAALD